MKPDATEANILADIARAKKLLADNGVQGPIKICVSQTLYNMVSPENRDGLVVVRRMRK